MISKLIRESPARTTQLMQIAGKFLRLTLFFFSLLELSTAARADFVYVLNSTDPSIVKIDSRTGEEVIRIGEAFPAGFNITAKKTEATFGRQGFVALQGDVELSFLFCNGRTGDGSGRKITLNRAGRPSTENYNDCK